MRRRALTTIALIPALLTLSSCTEESTPTGPGGGKDTGTPAELSVAANSWMARALMPTGRLALAAAIVKNSLQQPVLYAIGGDDGNGVTLAVVEAYNYTTNSWSTRTPLPVRLESTNGAAVVAGKIYVSGGRDLDNNSPGSDDGAPRKSLYVYNPARNSWTRKADMPGASMFGVTGVISGKLYVLDGNTTSFYRYDPATDSWTQLASCPTLHGSGAGAVINGKFYVAGGVKFTRTGPFYVSRLHVYDPLTNTWLEKAPMLRGAGGVAGAALRGQFYVLGGTSAGDVARNWVQAYDPVGNSWSFKAPMPTWRTNLAASNVVTNGQQRIALVGGYGGLGNRWLRSNDIYTP